MEAKDFSVLPCHVGVIMDGNGRWAKKQGLERSKGHIEGAKVFRRIGEYAGNLGIRHISFYAFSTENWSRPQNEVDAIMSLFYEYLEESKSRLDEDLEKGIRVRFFGDRSKLSDEIVSLMSYMEEATADMEKIDLNLCINYGGRQEILLAAKSLAKAAANGLINPDEITEKDIEDRLYTRTQPPVDLIIRPSGEMRLSNFLLWQAAYAEFWVSDVLWPDFTEKSFDEALLAYKKRNRRFGGI